MSKQTKNYSERDRYERVAEKKNLAKRKSVKDKRFHVVEDEDEDDFEDEYHVEYDYLMKGKKNG